MPLKFTKLLENNIIEKKSIDFITKKYILYTCLMFIF